MLSTKLTKAILFTLAIGATAACSSGGKPGLPVEGDAFLTIVGDKNVFMENGISQKLTIRYHDASDRPLAGQVGFRIVGDANGATLGGVSAYTNAQGVAEIDVTSGDDGEATFQIQATAPEAAAAQWTIAVSSLGPDLDPSGRYELSSKFDVISGLDTGAGKAINIFIDLSDDPGGFLIDLAVDELDGAAATALDLLGQVVKDELNQAIEENAPDFVLDIKEVGMMLEDVSRHFGTTSILDISNASDGDADSSKYEATHGISGFNFNIQGDDYIYTMKDLQIDEIEAENIGISVGQDRMLNIDSHNLPISYGSMLVVALEQGIIPILDDTANHLDEYLQNQIDCTAFATNLYNNTDFFLESVSLYESICQIALEAAADLAIAQLLKIDDDGVALAISGKTRPRDTNGDRKVDTLQSGKWSGAVDYAGTLADLDPDENRFTGTRMGASTN